MPHWIHQLWRLEAFKKERKTESKRLETLILIYNKLFLLVHVILCILFWRIFYRSNGVGRAQIYFYFFPLLPPRLKPGVICYKFDAVINPTTPLGAYFVLEDCVQVFN